MSFSPVPQYSFRELTDIAPEFLKRLGVRLLMLDLDNTVAAYSEHSPSSGVALWVADIKGHDIKMVIVSNSVRVGRVEEFAKVLQIDFIKGAAKPSPKCVTQIMKESGFNPDETALVGDQIFTDTLAANRAGVVSIVIRPRRFTNPFLALRYALEAPFRVICRNKFRNSEF